MIDYMIKMHKFFVAESRSYVDPYGLRERVYYPIAYCRFMWLCYWDFVRQGQRPND